MLMMTMPIMSVCVAMGSVFMGVFCGDHLAIMGGLVGFLFGLLAGTQK